MLKNSFIYIALILSFYFSLKNILFAQHSSRYLSCSSANNIFYVNDGYKTWTYNVSGFGWDFELVQCGKESAAAIIGNEFLFFNRNQNQILSTKINYFDSDEIKLSVDEDTAAALVENNIYIVRSRQNTLRKSIMSFEEIKHFKVSNNLVFLQYGNQFVVNRHSQFYQYNLDHNTQNSLFMTKDSMGALVSGKSFVVFNGVNFKKIDFKTARKPEELLFYAKYGFATVQGDTFYIFDQLSSSFKFKKIGSKGKLLLIKKEPTYITDNDEKYIYSSISGDFVKKEYNSH